jgi:hemoglobin-like flavoprotein
MTASQIKLVQESFPSISEQGGAIAMLFYGRLFQMQPQLRPMFRQDIQLQGQKLMDMLSTLTGSLDRFATLTPILRALGQRHAGYGVRDEHYTAVSTALLWALGTALDGEFPQDLKSAWVAVIDAVSDVMKAGAAEVKVS